MHSFPEAVAEVSLKIGGPPGFPREATALCRGEHSAGVPPDKVPWHGTGAPQGWGAPGQVVAGGGGSEKGTPRWGHDQALCRTGWVLTPGPALLEMGANEQGCFLQCLLSQR